MEDLLRPVATIAQDENKLNNIYRYSIEKGRMNETKRTTITGVVRRVRHGQQILNFVWAIMQM